MRLYLKAMSIWLVMVFFAILNGIFRENVLLPYLGESISLPLSGITLSLLIFAITYFSFKLFEGQSSRTYLLIGLLWVVMTLSFEFLFGHYVMGHTWGELLKVFDVNGGNLFVVSLLFSLFSPLVVSKLR